MRDNSGGARPTRLAREKLAASSDPLRVAIATRLTRDPATASQLSAKLGIEPPRVRQLLRRMREVGLVEVVGTTGTAGVRENLYASDPTRFVLDPEELARFSPEEADRAAASLVRMMFRESMSVLESAPDAAREEFVLRLPLPLDGRGWAEAAALFSETVAELAAVGQQSQRRLAGSAEEAFDTLAIVLFFALAESVAEQEPIEPTVERERG